MISKAVGVETKREANGMEAKNAKTLRRIKVMKSLILSKKVAKGEKKKEKIEATRLKGTMRNPTHGMTKRLVTNPMGEIRLKWSATKGAVPRVATAVTRREIFIYFQIFFFHVAFEGRDSPSFFSPSRILGTI